MNIYYIFAILLILACLGILGFAFSKKHPAPGTTLRTQTKVIKFQGRIKNIITDCFTTGACSVILEPNIVIQVAENPGDVSPEIREKIMGASPWGRLIGFELAEKYIGRIVEVYAKDAGILKNNNAHYYTLKGDPDYYIKLLPE